MSVGFENGIVLQGADLQVGEGRARLELTWIVTRPLWVVQNPADDPTIFVHLFTCNGDIAALADGAALGGAYPFRLARAGDEITDVREFALDVSDPAGCYTGETGLFRPADGSRLSATGADGQRLVNDLLPLAP